ncbi:hypothetical protein PNI0360_00907, partial [Streptococcus pneumoniae PNI0360]
RVTLLLYYLFAHNKRELFLRKSIEYAIKRLYHIVYYFWFILL